jgi:ubiquinone/menaquinone biosynthesis C-methylase UbiE
MSATTEFTLAHYLLATEGVALMRSWCQDDQGQSRQFINEIAEICHELGRAPYTDAIRLVEQPPVAGYTAWAPTYDADNRANPLIELESEALDALLAPVSGGHALDAACGTGRQAGRLLRLGYQVTGVDATPAMLDVARRHHPQARHLEGDLRAIPLPDAEFDLVLCTLALTHIAELDQVMAEFSRVTRPGGRVVVIDVHPIQVLLGSHVTVSELSDSAAVVRNCTHYASRYLAAFKAAGLIIESCAEPVFTERSVAILRAAEHIADANRAAFLGTPALFVWDVRKSHPGEERGPQR